MSKSTKTGRMHMRPVYLYGVLVDADGPVAHAMLKG
jgi:hypothetical protein